MMMEFKWMGALTKREVTALLRKRGCNIKDENELNLIMKEMGLFNCFEGQWSTTEDAVKYIDSNSQIVDEDIWRPSVVDAIYKFLGE